MCPSAMSDSDGGPGGRDPVSGTPIGSSPRGVLHHRGPSASMAASPSTSQGGHDPLDTGVGWGSGRAVDAGREVVLLVTRQAQPVGRRHRVGSATADLLTACPSPRGASLLAAVSETSPRVMLPGVPFPGNGTGSAGRLGNTMFTGPNAPPPGRRPVAARRKGVDHLAPDGSLRGSGAACRVRAVRSRRRASPRRRGPFRRSGCRGRGAATRAVRRWRHDRCRAWPGRA